MNQTVKNVQKTLVTMGNNFQADVDRAVAAVKSSLQDSARQTLKEAGAVSKEEAKEIINNGGKVLDSKNPGRDFNNYIGDSINGYLFRYGLLMVVAAVGILSLTKMLPTEQIVKVVKA